ncbi:unnamed protein product, partial [Porites evermanni]
DTVIYLAIKSTNDCIQLQQHLLNLEKWVSDWKMEFILHITGKCHPLVSHKDANLQSTGHSYSTRSPAEYSDSQQPLGITTSIPSTQGQLQNETSSQGI